MVVVVRAADAEATLVALAALHRLPVSVQRVRSGVVVTALALFLDVHRIYKFDTYPRQRGVRIAKATKEGFS